MRNSIKPVNVAIAVGSLLFVVAWHWIATLHKPRLDKIAAELVATREFVLAPSPNHAGTKLLYVETVEHGTAGYFVDTSSGQMKPLANATSVPYLGWSPDDKLFAYLLGSPNKGIAICDGNTAETLATIPETKTVSGGVWLSDEAFVYVSGGQTPTLLSKSGGDWHKSSLFTKKPATGQDNPDAATIVNPATGKKIAVRTNPADTVQYLAAISEKSVAWQQGGAIWKFDLGSDAPAKIWESTTNTLLNFCFSGERNCFTLHCRNAAGEFRFDLYPAFIWRDERISGFESIKPPSGAVITSLKFIRSGLGYAYLARGQTFDATVVKPDSNSVPIQLTWAAGVDSDSLAANDNHVYATGSPTNGPLDIWDYDVKARSLTSVVSGLEHPFQYAGAVPAVCKTAANANGQTVVYYLSQPVNFVAGRKYPLVIGFNGVRWRPQEAAVPNAGCFMASLNSVPSNEGDVVAVYQAAIQNPSVDASRVYVMGSSASAGYAAHLLQATPELWRGAVLLSLLYFPDTSELKVSRILMDSGVGDEYLKQEGGVTLLTQFQDAAALSGIPVTLSINKSAGHIYRSKIAEGERVKQTIEFLSTD